MEIALYALTLGIFAAVGQEDAGRAVQGQSPFACNRLGLTAQERKRHFEELGPTLRNLRTGVRELPDGYAFEFPATFETLRLVAEWAAGERLCCPFFDIDIKLKREAGSLSLILTGRDGVKDFIKVEGAAWLEP